MTISEGAVLVCGLGALGQACLERLLPFQVPLVGVDLQPPQWRCEELELGISAVIQGDMRQARVLQRAGLDHCRAVLLLSADSQVNLEAALLVRLLNPEADVVVRSSSGEQAIGHLLEQRLPRIAVVDPLVLTADAVANAIQPANERIQLARSEDGSSIHLLRSNERPSGSACRPLRHQSGSNPSLWVTVRQPRGLGRLPKGSTAKRLQQAWRRLPTLWDEWRRRRSLHWLPVALVAVVAGISLFSSRGGSWQRGLLITLGLLQGEYVDPVMLLQGPSLGHLLLALAYALTGTLITSALVALILEHFLSERLGLRRRQRLRSGSRQALVVDGQEVVEPIRSLLAAERIAVQTASLSDGIAGLERELGRLHHTEVVGIGLLSANLLTNVHAALKLQSSGAPYRLAVLAHQMEASEQLGDLLGGISVISGVDLAADALVATAFGERVERVVQITGTNRLVVRYRLEEGDHLCGLNIARVENAYQVNVLCHRRHGRPGERAIPPLDSPLHPGDELLVLASLEGLRRVECGLPAAPQWRVELRVPSPHPDHFLVQQCLARCLGLAPGQVQSYLDGQWHRSSPLDRDLGEQFCMELHRLRVESRLCAESEGIHRA